MLNIIWERREKLPQNGFDKTSCDWCSGMQKASTESNYYTNEGSLTLDVLYISASGVYHFDYINYDIWHH